MKLPATIQTVLNTLNEHGYQAYVVGGCVRDAMLQRECHDYDVATNATPEIVLSLFSHAIPTGLKHGTVTVILENQIIEVTTFRKESEYLDHRHPTSVQYVSSIEEDVSRRDFTVNAMAFHPKTGMIDVYGGKEDLQNQVIRCVGNPDIRFQEDALRMMRAHRFAAKLGFTIEETTLSSIQSNAHLIKHIAIERIVKEFIEILRYNPYEIENMTELMSYIMPELNQAKECDQISPWHDTNVLHHTLRSIRVLSPFDETLAFALLMHDLGKMETKTTIDGRDHFYGHPKVSKEISKRLCRELKLTSIQRKVIPSLIEHHDDSLKLSLKHIYKLRIQHGYDDHWMKQLLEIKRCDILAHSLKGQETIHQWEKFKEFYQECVDIRPMAISQLSISGRDILEHTSLQGKAIHNALMECLTICFYEPERNKKEELIAFVQRNQERLGKKE